MRFVMQIRESKLVGWSRPTINRLLRFEFAKIGRWWHRVARPRHFNMGAYQRYGAVYRRRAKGYSRWKRRRFGHSRPLFLTGDTFRASSGHNIKATRNGVTVTYPGLRGLNRRPRGSKINKVAEFQYISNQENQHMATLVANSIDRKMQTAAANGGRLTLRN